MSTNHIVPFSQNLSVCTSEAQHHIDFSIEKLTGNFFDGLLVSCCQLSVVIVCEGR